jgi:hypothetical protein
MSVRLSDTDGYDTDGCICTETTVGKTECPVHGKPLLPETPASAPESDSKPLSPPAPTKEPPEQQEPSEEYRSNRLGRAVVCQEVRVFALQSANPEPLLKQLSNEWCARIARKLRCRQ